MTYRRLAQWRRNEALIRNSNRVVFENAALYLGLPTLFVPIRADVVRLDDFLWPGKRTLNDHVNDEIVRMQQDKWIGPFVPDELDKAAANIRMLVAYLFHEVERNAGARASLENWLEEIRKEVEANANLRSAGVADPERK